MAVAPLNKFLTIAAPVAPGEQTIYEAPVGTSAIVLYAQVANVHVGIGTTYPTVTFTHRRKSVATRTVGNTRNHRLIRDGEVPPNDALIIIDGRLVLERTAVVSDSIVISGVQTGISTIMNVDYDNSTGITTVRTLEPHGFSVGQEITMAGIAFTCSGTYGLTTSIFPEPQAAFTINEVPNDKSFITNSGIVNALKHVYRPAFHKFIRSNADAITDASGVLGPYTPTGSEYDSISGIATFTIPSHGLTAPTSHKAGAGTTYNPNVGIMTVTVDATPDPAFQEGELVKFEEGAVTFSCSYGSGGSASYPRSKDPYVNQYIPISNVSGSTFQVNVGAARGDYNHVFVPNKNAAIDAIITGGNYAHTFKPLDSSSNSINVVDGPSAGQQKTPSAVDYNPETGTLTLTVSGHGISDGNEINFDNNSLVFTCSMDDHATKHSYPRSTDPIAGVNTAITYISADQFSVNVGISSTVRYTPTNATYNPNTGEMVLTLPAGYNNNRPQSTTTAETGTTYDPATGQLDIKITGHSLTLGDKIRIADGAITFKCAKDGNSSTHPYPRSTDPQSNKWLPITYVDTDTVRVAISPAGPDGQFTHQWHSSVSGGIKIASDSIKLKPYSIVFTCDADNYATEHPYPRTTDPVYDTSISIGNTTTNSISLYVGKSKVTQPHFFESADPNKIKRARDTIKIDANSLIYKCSQDGFLTEHSYPRTSDPIYNKALGVDVVGVNTISTFVGISTAGGLVAPLQMEFVCSILENSTT